MIRPVWKETRRRSLGGGATGPPGPTPALRRDLEEKRRLTENDAFVFKKTPSSGGLERGRASNAPAEARLQVNTHPARVKTNKRVSPRK